MKGSAGGNVDYQGKKPGEQKVGDRQDLSSKDSAQGLPGLQMVPGLVALGIPLFPALGMCPAILEPQRTVF